MTYEIYKKEMAELMKNHSGKEDSTKIIEAARDELDHHFEAGEPNYSLEIVTIPVPVEKSEQGGSRCQVSSVETE